MYLYVYSNIQTGLGYAVSHYFGSFGSTNVSAYCDIGKEIFKMARIVKKSVKVGILYYTGFLGFKKLHFMLSYVYDFLPFVRLIYANIFQNQFLKNTID